MNFTFDWKNSEAVDEVYSLINRIGNPSSIEMDLENEKVKALVWEKDSESSSLKGTIYERIEIRDTEGKIFYPKSLSKSNSKNTLEKKTFKHFVSVSISYDLTQSEYRDQIFFEMKAPIEFFPQKKLLTIYGPTLTACLSTLMVITNCAMKEGCPVKKVSDDSLLLKAFEYANSHQKEVLQQVVANLKSSKSPGNPIPETE